jgi:hypothetical protein
MCSESEFKKVVVYVLRRRVNTKGVSINNFCMIKNEVNSIC